MEDNIAIQVKDVYKDFLLPHEKTESLKSAFTSILKGKKRRTVERQHALHDINFDIKKGEFFGIVGRNGSGKSTLLKIIAQIYQPTKGGVTVQGRLVPFIELGVGFNPELTGRENVYLSAALMGFSKKEIDAMYNNIVDFAELEKFMDQKLKNYSSGMQVRLAFSIATRAQGDILLIDEVLAVGDADFQRKCFNYFRELKKNKRTVVFVSHDMSAIREYCDRVVLIEKSKIVHQGKPEEVAMEYTKMFTKTNGSKGAGKDERWGTGDVEATSLKVLPNKIDQTVDKLTIKASFKAKSSIISPVVGIKVNNSAGSPVLGTNSKILHKNLADMVAGEILEVSFGIPNIFADDTYSFDIAITDSSGTTVYDWWDNAASFVVYKDTKTPYLVNPDITIISTIHRSEK